MEAIVHNVDTGGTAFDIMTVRISYTWPSLFSGWTQDWIVGLDSQKLALVISASQKYTASTTDNSLPSTRGLTTQLGSEEHAVVIASKLFLHKASTAAPRLHRGRVSSAQL